MITKTVDIRSFLDLKDDNFSKKKEISIAFLKAFNSKGCVSIIGHGIENDIVNSAFKTSREFFNCPEEIKRLACSKDRARRGYSPKLSENLGSLLELNVPNDTVEKFRIGPLLSDKEKESDDAYYDSKEGRLFFFPNIFTGTTPSLESALVTYYKEMEKLSKIILEILELAFDLPESYFKRKMDKHTSILNVNNYYTSYEKEQKSQERKVTRIAPHTDLSVITITAQTAYQVASSGEDSRDSETRGYFSTHPNHTIDGDIDNDLDEDDIMTDDERIIGGGLEVYDNETLKWTCVPYAPNALIVNIGDCLSSWSEGMLKSSLHRVVLNNDGIKSFNKNILSSTARLEERSKSVAIVNIDMPLSLNEESSESIQETINESDISDGRLSLVYFVSPNHDALLDWPIAERNPMISPQTSTVPCVTIKEPAKYSYWRKNRIKTVKPPLNPKKMQLNK
jgi:isopenicillin N synthase-like dioxygenase